jgi:hypothetical protein
VSAVVLLVLVLVCLMRWMGGRTGDAGSCGGTVGSQTLIALGCRELQVCWLGHSWCETDRGGSAPGSSFGVLCWAWLQGLPAGLVLVGGLLKQPGLSVGAFPFVWTVLPAKGTVWY